MNRDLGALVSRWFRLSRWGEMTERWTKLPGVERICPGSGSGNFPLSPGAEISGGREFNEATGSRRSLPALPLEVNTDT